MSEPMSSVEIEDVLSSIRRLVSEDLRPSSAARPATPAPQGLADAEGRLILTPALRVVGGEVEAEAEVGAETEAAVQAAPKPAEPERFEPEAAEAPAAAPQFDDTPDLNVTPEHWADDRADDRAEDSYEAVDAMDFDTADAPDVVPEAPATDAPSVIEGVMASLSQQVHDDNWEPETGDTIEDHPALHWADGAWAEPGPRSPDFDRIDQAEEAELAPVETSPQGLEAWGEPEGWAEAMSPEAAFDAAVFELPPEAALPPEAEAPEGGDAAEAEAIAAIEAMRVAEELEQATLERLEDEGATGPGLFDSDEGGFDEEALREIVRDIIREELQGTLGERITRNVRKLVRAEVARAAMMRDYE